MALRASVLWRIVFQLIQAPKAGDAWNHCFGAVADRSTKPLFEPLSAEGLGLEAAAELINFGAVELGDLCCASSVRDGGSTWLSAHGAVAAGLLCPGKLGLLAWDKVVAEARAMGAEPTLRRRTRLQLGQLAGGERVIG